MKSSKVENLLTLSTKMDEAKTLSPLTYYQPFQSSFDPEFASESTRSNSKHEAVSKKWRQAPDKTSFAFRGDESITFGKETGSRESFGFGPNFYGRRSENSRNVFLADSSSPLAMSTEDAKKNCRATQKSSAWSSSCLLDEKNNLPTPNPEIPKSLVWWQGSSPKCCKSDNSSFTPYATDLQAGRFFGNKNLTHRERITPTSECEASGSASVFHPLVARPQVKGFPQNLYKTGHNRPMICNFCKNNKEVPDIYLNHYLYDPETKVLTCPVLRKHVCEICGGTGDRAHTLQYCPVTRERGLQAKVPVLLKTRTITNSTGKLRRN